MGTSIGGRFGGATDAGGAGGWPAPDRAAAGARCPRLYGNVPIDRHLTALHSILDT